MGVGGVRQALPDGGGGGRKGVGRAWGAGESAVLQSGKCCAFTGLAAFAASPGGIRRLPVSKLPAHILSTPSCPARSYDRVGGISLNLRNSDLSHHRAYRSVHGGSINLTSNTPFDVVI